MNLTYAGSVSLEATALGNTITSAGKSFANAIPFNGIGGGWTLLDAFSSTLDLLLNNGTLNTNNQTVNVRSFISTTATARTLNMGSSIFNLSSTSGIWSVNAAGMTLNCGTSTINAIATAGASPSFAGGNLTYYDLNFVSANANSGQINGNNTFHNVSFAAAGFISGNNTINDATFGKNGTIQGNNTYNNLTFTAGYTYVLTSGRTQTINGNFSASGNCNALIAINSSTSGSQSTMSHPPGAVIVSFVTLKDINATGGATFTANNSVDLGNNTGWIINTLTSRDLYWIGGTGNWGDGSHWSLSSGGPSLGCTPLQMDNVFFDANSYSASGQITTINVPTAYCRDMTWTGATNNPTLTGATPLKIYGSLTFIPGMNLTFTGSVSFEATALGNTVTTGGKSFNNTVTFNGIGGGWTLLDAFTSINDLFLNNGILTTNNQTVNARSFFSTSGTARTLNMGSSIFNLSSTSGIWSATAAGMTLNCGTSTINSTTNGAGNNPSFNGGNLTYYDLNFVGANTFQGNIFGNNIFNNITFAANGLIQNNNTINDATFSKHGMIQGNNTYNNLTFSAGYTYILTSGRTQTINGSFISSGNCNALIEINSNAPGSQSTISHPPGAVVVSFVILKDINATGGATFTANNSVDLGNNTGWTINGQAIQNLYWVGGTGDWNNPAHWSLSSGGPPSGCIPTPTDNVFFDVNSYSAPGQTTTISFPTAYCRDMTWTGVTNNPTFTGTATNLLKIYGSLTFAAGMNLTFTGPVRFEATALGNTITSAGKSFTNTVTFIGIGGGWTLLDVFASTSDVLLNNGILNTNNQTVNVRYFNSTTASARTLNMGSSIFNLSSTSGIWLVTAAGMTLNCGTSTINAIATAGANLSFNGGNFTYYDLNFVSANANSGQINGNNTFHNVSFAAAGFISGNNTINDATFSKNGTIQGNNTYNNLTFTAGFTYVLTSGRTQTINGNFTASGNCGATIAINSSTSGSQSTISHPPGAVVVSFVTLKDINATGGATFTANNSVDLGNNTGWTINPLSSQNFYWIGGTGVWSDGNHWSLTSGGPPSFCSPSLALDNVFFDANSYSAPGQITTIDVPTAYCRNMTWTGVTNNPTLAGATSLKIYGSLTFVPGMNLTFTGPVSFDATALGNTVTTGGKSFNNTVTFNGIGGGWTLQDAFTSTNNLLLNNGILTTNNQTVNARTFFSTSGTARTLNMGSSIFNLSDVSFCWQVISTGLTLNCGTSTINSTTNGAGNNPSFNGGNLTYYDMNFVGINTNSGLINGNNIFHNVTFAADGSISGNNTINNATFNKNGTIQGNNTYNNLTFSAGYTYVLTNGRIQTILSQFLIQGSCISYIFLQSSLAGSFSTITKATGNVLGYNIHMRDIHAIGGANFIAYNSVDLGGNSGWSFLALPPLSVPGAIVGPASVCAGATGVTYYIPPATGAISYLWTVPLGATITSPLGDTLITVNFGSATSGNITVLASSGCEFSLSSTLAVTVIPFPTVNSVPDLAACAGSSTTAINFSGAVSGTVFNWTNNNTLIGLGASGTGDILSFTALNAGVVPVTGTITVTPSYTAGALTCTGTPKTFTITVNPIPNANTVLNQTLCAGASTTIINFNGVVTGTVYNWTNNTPSIGLAPNGTGDILPFTALNAGTTPITASITVTPAYTNNGVTCLGTPVIFSITVNPIPNVIQPSDQAFCNDASTSLISFSGPVIGTTYSWTNDNTSIGIGASGTGDITSFIATNITTLPVIATITVTPTYSNGGVTCSGPVKIFTITVNPTPNVNQPSNQSVCNGSTTTLISFTGSAVNGTVYTWTNNTTSIGLGASGTGDIPSFTATNISASQVIATITVTPTYSNGGVTCSGPVKTFTITVNPTPNVNQPSNYVVCNGASTSLISFSGSAIGTTYSWTNDNTSIGIGTSGTGDITSFIATNITTSPVIATITVTPTNSNGGVTCPGSVKIFTITVNPTSNVNQPSNQSVCNGSTTTLISFTGSAVNGTVYTWTNNTTSIGLGASGTGDIPSFTAANISASQVIATITVTPTYSNGGVTCSGPVKTITITVNPVPVISFNPVSASILFSNSVQLNATITGPYISYLWTPSTGLNNPAILNPIASPATTTVYKLSVVAPNNCNAEKTLPVTVYKNIYVPNSFTPDGNGINDIFRIPPGTALKLQYFQIYDRYGNLIFRTSDINTGWDGTYKGAKLPVGAYNYIIKGFDLKREIFIQGSVILIR